MTHQADPVEGVTCRLRQSRLLTDNNLARRLEAWNLRAVEATDHIATLETRLAHRTEAAGEMAKALERCAKIVENNLYRQHEKVEDVPLIARRALTAYEQSQRRNRDERS